MNAQISNSNQVFIDFGKWSDVENSFYGTDEQADEQEENKQRETTYKIIIPQVVHHTEYPQISDEVDYNDYEIFDIEYFKDYDMKHEERDHNYGQVKLNEDNYLNGDRKDEYWEENKFIGKIVYHSKVDGSVREEYF